jgi:hypothetical protein
MSNTSHTSSILNDFRFVLGISGAVVLGILILCKIFQPFGGTSGTQMQVTDAASVTETVVTPQAVDTLVEPGESLPVDSIVPTESISDPQLTVDPVTPTVSSG